MKINQVDAFTDEIFKGNPAGVCILPGPADERWMQDVAMEMNLSETAFLYSQDNGFNLRWFTPEVEVDLCGHATLASAHILWEANILKADTEAVFFTKSGRLSAKDELTAYQASERGGTLKVHVDGSRVYISGKAITVFCADFSDQMRL